MLREFLHECIHKALDKGFVFIFLCLAALSLLNRYWDIMMFLSVLSYTDITRAIREEKDGWNVWYT